MKVDVFVSPTEMVSGDTQGRVVAVIDVLRASTTIAAAVPRLDVKIRIVFLKSTV